MAEKSRCCDKGDYLKIMSMNIGVFCSANNNIDKLYFEKTRELGEWIAARGYGLVSGGSNRGLMQCIHDAVHDNGGRSVGIIPTLLEKDSRVIEDLDEKVLCDTLSDRKDIMISRSDVLVVLPGGVGTLDEFFTTLCAATLGYHDKPVVLYNIAGFYDSLIACLDDLMSKGVLRKTFTDLFRVVTDFKGLTAFLSSL